MYLTNYEELKRFCEENNRFPNGNRSKEERRLYQFYYVNSHIERFKLLHDMYVKKCHEYSLEELKEFCKKNKRMPTALTNRYEKALYAFYVRHKDEKEFKDLHNKYTKIYKAFTIDDLKNSVRKTTDFLELDIQLKAKMKNYYMVFYRGIKMNQNLNNYAKDMG